MKEASTEAALLFGIGFDVLDVFVGQIQEAAGSRGIGDLTGQPSALLDLCECRV